MNCQHKQLLCRFFAVGWGGVGCGGMGSPFGAPHLTYFSLMGILRVEKEAVYLLMKNIMTSFIYSRAEDWAGGGETADPAGCLADWGRACYEAWGRGRCSWGKGTDKDDPETAILSDSLKSHGMV